MGSVVNVAEQVALILALPAQEQEEAVLAILDGASGPETEALLEALEEAGAGTVGSV